MSKKPNHNSLANQKIHSRPDFELACHHKGAPTTKLARLAVKAGVPVGAVLRNYDSRQPV